MPELGFGFPGLRMDQELSGKVRLLVFSPVGDHPGNHLSRARFEMRRLSLYDQKIADPGDKIAYMIVK